MTMIPPPPVADALAQATRAPGSGAIRREPFQILLAWLLDFCARDDLDLEPALKSALPAGPPCCCMTLPERLDRLVSVVRQMAEDAEGVSEEDHTFLRLVLRAWIQSLGARMA